MLVHSTYPCSTDHRLTLFYHSLRNLHYFSPVYQIILFYLVILIFQPCLKSTILLLISQLTSISFNMYHFVLLFNLSHLKPARPYITRTRRKLLNISIPYLISDIDLYTALHTGLSSTDLHISLSLLLDKHAPEITKTVISRPDSSWYTPHLLKQK